MLRSVIHRIAKLDNDGVQKLIITLTVKATFRIDEFNDIVNWEEACASHGEIIKRKVEVVSNANS